MLDIKKVNMSEFSSKFDGDFFSDDSLTENSHSFFLFGEKSGVIRDDTLGSVEFINIPTEELSINEEMELLVNICGRPGEFTDTVKVPNMRTVMDYQEEARYIDKVSLLIWIAQIAFILIPIALTLWLISLFCSIS